MGLRIPQLLDAILEATATEQGAKARIAGIRAALEDEARRRYADEGAAPSWNAPKMGKVRYDPPSEWTAMVADPQAFGSWVAEHHPTEVTIGIGIKPDDAEAAIEALTFAGIPHVASTVVRPAWSGPYLKGLTVDVEEIVDGGEGPVDRVFTIVDPDTGECPPGLTGDRSAGKLVVSLDPARRTAAIEVAKGEAEEVILGATEGDTAPADQQALAVRRQELEGFNADVLKAYAGRLDLGGSGTKAELAERIARAEALTGRRELLTASSLTDHRGDAVAPRPDADGAQAPIGDGGSVERGAGRTPPAAPPPTEEPAGVQRAQDLEAAYPRETLRAYAKAKGLPASGTKADVAHRIASAGHTVDDVRLMHATQE